MAGQNTSNRPGWILIVFMTAASLAMVAAVWWYYTVQKREIEAAAFRELLAVARGKTDQIANWRRERLGDGRVVMEAAMPLLKRVLSGRTKAGDRDGVLKFVRSLAREFSYSDISLVDLDGSVRMRLNEDRTDEADIQRRFRRQLAREAVTANDVVLSDLTPNSRTGRPMMSLTVPVGGDGGGLIMEIDPARFLYPYLDVWPGASRTAESLLVRREGRQIVNLSRIRNAPEMQVFSLRATPRQTPSDSVLEAGWSGAALDYRGVPVLAAARRVPNSPWFLICKTDRSEVEAPLHRLAWEMALFTALIGLANAAGVGMVWRDQRARFHKERESWLYSAQEDERKRLARELHDDLNQQVAALAIATGNLKRQIPEAQAEARGQSDRIHHKLVQLSESVRRMSHELHPAMLEYAGLAGALRAYCDELTDLRVTLHLHGSFDAVPAAAALCIYRIVQEALRNVAKHAKVREATVELTHDDGMLRLVVSDAGIGMQPEGTRTTAGLGLVSIQERTRIAGGWARIESKANRGTTITVAIPSG